MNLFLPLFCDFNTLCLGFILIFGHVLRGQFYTFVCEVPLSSSGSRWVWCSILDLWYPYLDDWYKFDFTSACKAGWVFDFLWVLCAQSFVCVVCCPPVLADWQAAPVQWVSCVLKGFGVLSEPRTPWLLLCMCLCESWFGSWGMSLYTLSLTIYSSNTFLAVL